MVMAMSNDPLGVQNLPFRISILSLMMMKDRKNGRHSWQKHNIVGNIVP